jgi:hypothetical protein
MSRRLVRVGLLVGLLFIAGGALLPRPARAYIERLYTLQEVMDQSTNILVAEVVSVDKEKQRATLQVVEDLKGVSNWKKINVNYAVGQYDHPALMMKRLAPGIPALMFYQAQGGSFAAETHCFGSWWQTHASDGPDRDNLWWSFTHIEIHLQRTYSGSTPAFIQLVKEILAKKKDSPAPNPMQASGPGPELPAVIPAAELLHPPPAPGKKPAVAKTSGGKSGSKTASAVATRALAATKTPSLQAAGIQSTTVNAGAPDKPATLPPPAKPAAPAIPAAAGPARSGELFTRELTLGNLGSPVLGVSWADYDGDGDPDAYACGAAGNHLFRNDGGGTFVDVTGPVGLSGGSRSAAWADYNGDGRPDLVTDTPRLFTGTKTGFRDDTALLPAALVSHSTSVAWVDADGDGRPDLLFGRETGGLTLLLNTGKTPPFQNATPRVTLPKGAATPVAGFLTVADLTGDGRPDVLCALKEFSLLQGRAGGGFAPMAASGIAAKPDPEWPVGPAVGDLDNDGLPDLFLPQRGGGKLYRNKGKGLFEEITARSPDLAQLKLPCRAGYWFDANGDGCLDLYVATEQGPGRLFINDRTGVLFDRTQQTALAGRGPGGGAAGVAAADFDRDGDQDLLMGSRSGRVIVQVNALQRSPAHAFVEVKASRIAAGMGASVELRSPSGRLLGLRQLSGGDNYGSQGEPAAFFAAKPGAYGLQVRLSNGALITRTLEVPAAGLRLDLDGKDAAGARPAAAPATKPGARPGSTTRKAAGPEISPRKQASSATGR